MKLGYDLEAARSHVGLGLVILAEDETLEPDFNKIFIGCPVAIYHARIAMGPHISAESLSAMEQDLPAAAALLPQAAGLGAIGYACTSAASVIGSDRVADLVRGVHPGSAVTDPMAAIIVAARHLGLTRLGFLTPYVLEVSAGMRDRLAETGLEVLAFGSFEQSDDRQVARITPDSIIEAAGQVLGQSNCDGLVIACTALRALDAIPDIERRYGVPVIASNAALAWQMARLADVPVVRPDLGRLFAG